MRLKYRAWIKSLKVMAKVVAIDFKKGEVLLKGSERNTVADFSQVILMQSTGVKDKNEKEIYEGDIVEYFRSGLSTIEWVYGGFVVKQANIGHFDFFNKLQGEIEVVGNIYKNPELLEASE